MNTSRIRLEAITRIDRFVVMESANAAVQAAGGWIDDVNFFSNISVVVSFSLPRGTTGEFLTALAAAGLRIGDAAGASLAEADLKPGSDAVRGSLHISFVHDDPDLRRTIPVVPG